MRALPGVRSAALTDWVPLSLGLRSRAIFIEGHPAERRGKGVEIDSAAVDPAYFRTLGIGLLLGREFAAGDGPGSPGVAVINQTMGRRFWPRENPIGKRFSTVGTGGPFLEVVGVVRRRQIPQPGRGVAGLLLSAGRAELFAWPEHDRADG